jgi:hypothetical protein
LKTCLNFSLRKWNWNNNGIYMDDSHISSNYEAIFPQSARHFSKTLYINAVKFPASALEHITKTLFQFAVICKMASTYCIHYRAKQVVVGGCQTWAVRRVGKNSPSHFLRLPHVCASWCEAGHCREGEGRLTCLRYDELYGCAVVVCL